MADATPISMAEEIKKAKEKYDELVRTLEKAREGITGLTSDGVSGFMALIEKSGKFADVVARIDPGSITKMTGALADALIKFDLFTVNVMQSNAVIAQFKKGADETFTGVSNSFLDIFNKIPAIQFGETVKKFELAKGFENEFTAAAASSGVLFDMFGKLGDSGKRWGQEMGQTLNFFTQASLSSANTMGIGVTDAMEKTMKIMAAVPTSVGAKHKMEAIDGVERNVSDLTLLMTVAKGTGQSFDDILKTGTEVYERWGYGLEQASTRTAVMVDVQQKLQVSFAQIKNVVSDVDKTFSMWGNNMEGTLSVLQKIHGVLSTQGLGIEQSTALVRNFATSIEHLSLSQRAFIGMQSGMTGGAVNAGLQIERMQQEGKFDQIAEMIQNTISKTTGGGRLLTLKEGAESPELASAYVTQRSILQQVSGVTDTGQANRLMDVMSKVQLGGERGIDAQKTLQEAFGRGQDVQERQYNALFAIQNNLKDVPAIASILMAYDPANGIGGPKGFIGKDFRAESMNLDKGPTTDKNIKGQEYMTGSESLMKDIIKRYGDPNDIIKGIQASLEESKAKAAEFGHNFANEVEDAAPGLADKAKNYLHKIFSKNDDVQNQTNHQTLQLSSERKTLELPRNIPTEGIQGQTNRANIENQTKSITIEVDIVDRVWGLIGQAKDYIIDKMEATNNQNGVGAMFGIGEDVGAMFSPGPSGR